MDELERLQTALNRVEARQDDVLRDISTLSHDLEQRIDRVGERIEEAREQSTRQHLALNRRFDKFRGEVDERLEDFDEGILKLGIKTGAELGKVRASADAVEKARERWRNVASGQILTRYRLLVWAVIALGGVVYGWSLVQFIAKLLGAPL